MLWFAKVSRQRSSLLRADHLGDEVDDGVGRLVRVQLGEEVADVVGCASLLTRHKPKQPGRSKNRNDLSALVSPCCAPPLCTHLAAPPSALLHLQNSNQEVC